MRPAPLAPLFLLLALPVLAQTQSTPSLSVTTRLVTVDVVVRDHGQPVRGLDQHNFTVFEDGHPQSIAFFEPHSDAASLSIQGQAPHAPSLPPGTFTNLPVTHVTDSVTVLLLDGLNTEAADQLYVRREMIRYLKNLPPGRRIAVFTLGDQLRLLQGFTDDAAILLAAVTSKQSTPLTSMRAPGNQTLEERAALDAMADAHVSPLTIDAYTNFMSETDAAEDSQRIGITLEAMQQLARYLGGIPGRKNLVWFSGSFPLQFFATERNPFHGDNNGQPLPVRDFNDLLRNTIDLFTAARVAVYPVDARGVLTESIFSAAEQGDYARVVHGSAVGALRAAQDSAMLAAQRVADHGTMDELAQQTGGRAVYDDNGLSEAFADALSDGSNFYTLAYIPANGHFDGRLRHIEIRVDQPGVRLDYRHSYYADDRSMPIEGGPDRQRKVFYAAMVRGVPPATQIVFEARITPLASASARSGKAPLDRYAVDFAIDPRAVDLTAAASGVRKGQLLIASGVWNRDGKLLRSAASLHPLALSPAQMRVADQSGLQCHTEVEAPAGDVYLRLGVYDPASGHMGTLEIPLAAALKATGPGN